MLALSAALRAWKISYARSIIVKITMGTPMGKVELLNPNGTGFTLPASGNGRWEQMQVIAHAFTTGATAKINANVATLLGLLHRLTRLTSETWNSTQNWWELSVNDAALLFKSGKG